MLIGMNMSTVHMAFVTGAAVLVEKLKQQVREKGDGEKNSKEVKKYRK